MSEESKAKVYGYKWVDSELIVGEHYPDDVEFLGTFVRADHFNSYLYCPECHKIDPQPLQTDITIETTNSNVKIYTDKLKYVAKCEDCNSDMVALDRYMAEPVSLLNISGYKTEASSQGRVTCIPGEREDVPEEEDYFFRLDSIPYIRFDKHYPDLEKINLPDGWFMIKEDRSDKDKLVYGIPGELVDYEGMKELDTDKIHLTMDGYEYIGFGIPVKELTSSIKDFLKKNQN